MQRHARELIVEWRHDYNRHRPHACLGGHTPVEFASRSNQGQSNDGLSLYRRHRSVKICGSPSAAFITVSENGTIFAADLAVAGKKMHSQI